MDWKSKKKNKLRNLKNLPRNFNLYYLKVVYFTSLFPYILLSVLLVKGLTLEGAWDGIKYLFIPRLDQLKNGEVYF